MTFPDPLNEPVDGLLYRASSDFEWKGRTIEGLAMPWDTWAIVRDLTGPAYPEAIARSNFDESLRRDPGPRALWSTHEYAFVPEAQPVGAVQFEKSSEALMFRAWFSRTPKGDDELELVRSGAKKAVSVGFRPLKSRPVQRPEGKGQLRVESMLRELSTAPTGFGQYPSARVRRIRGPHNAEEDAISDEETEQDPYARLRAQNLLRLRAGRPLIPVPVDPPAQSGTSSRPAEGHDEEQQEPHDNESEN